MSFKFSPIRTQLYIIRIFHNSNNFTISPSGKFPSKLSMMLIISCMGNLYLYIITYTYMPHRTGGVIPIGIILFGVEKVALYITICHKYYNRRFILSQWVIKWKIIARFIFHFFLLASRVTVSPIILEKIWMVNPRLCILVSSIISFIFIYRESFFKAGCS